MKNKIIYSLMVFGAIGTVLTGCAIDAGEIFLNSDGVDDELQSTISPEPPENDLNVALPMTSLINPERADEIKTEIEALKKLPINDLRGNKLADLVYELAVVEGRAIYLQTSN